MSASVLLAKVVLEGQAGAWVQWGDVSAVKSLPSEMVAHVYWVSSQCHCSVVFRLRRHEILKISL